MLTNAQKTALATALRAETDPSVVAALAIRDDVALTAWCNAASATDAWKFAALRRDLFEATNVAKFDNLTAGKRDAWKLMMDNSPVDFTRQPMRNSVVDVWGAADAVAVLQACTEKATHAEAYLGGTSRTTNTVVAISRSFSGAVSLTEVSQALNG
jgi:hypothetical protein